MEGVCKARDAVWRAEAAYNVAYQCLLIAEQTQRQLTEMHEILRQLQAEIVPEAEPRGGRTI